MCIYRSFVTSLYAHIPYMHMYYVYEHMFHIYAYLLYMCISENCAYIVDSHIRKICGCMEDICMYKSYKFMEDMSI